MRLVKVYLTGSLGICSPSRYSGTPSPLISMLVTGLSPSQQLRILYALLLTRPAVFVGMR